jgi:hypothetical protein
LPAFAVQIAASMVINTQKGYYPFSFHLDKMHDLLYLERKTFDFLLLEV